MMQFALLASGSKGNCFLLKDRDLTLMVDCGTTFRYLRECFASLHMSPEDLDAVLITHAHSDHISQISHFCAQPVYSPVKLPDTETIPVYPQKSIQLKHLRITPLALSHDAINTTGYIFESDTEKLDYITDTGYLKEDYLPLLNNPDYIILESNHDVEMLMQTRRPQYVKARICSDSGHLCNEDCASVLDAIVTKRTRGIILAHISEEANTRQKALEVSRKQLLKHHAGHLNRELMLCAAGQYEMIEGGEGHEKMDNCSCICAVGMECMDDI